jgi:transposase
MGYSSDLSDKEWEIIEPLPPIKKKTRPPVWTKWQILNGIFYQLKNGCNWGDLPKDLPRTSQKKPQWTTLIMIDSQAVKNTCNAGVESKGFCFYATFVGEASPTKLAYKCTNGIKRHLAVDILGWRDVKAWSKILTAHFNVPTLSSSCVLFV